jgi:hypothetical protein
MYNTLGVKQTSTVKNKYQHDVHVRPDPPLANFFQPIAKTAFSFPHGIHKSMFHRLL